MQTTNFPCVDCGLYGGKHEITCAFADDAPLPPPPPPVAKVDCFAVVDGERVDCVAVREDMPLAEIKQKLADRVATRLYQQTYAPVEALPIFTVERVAARPLRRRRA